MINGGFFVLSPKVIDYISDDKTIWERGPMERMAEEGNLAAFHHEGFGSQWTHCATRCTLRSCGNLERRHGRCGSESSILERQARSFDRAHRFQGKLALALAAIHGRTGGGLCACAADESQFVRGCRRRQSMTSIIATSAIWSICAQCLPNINRILLSTWQRKRWCATPMRAVETYSTNVMGTVNLLEAVRGTDSVKAVVNVTSDKCYENREWVWATRRTKRWAP